MAQQEAGLGERFTNRFWVIGIGLLALGQQLSGIRHTFHIGEPDWSRAPGDGYEYGTPPQIAPMDGLQPEN